MYIKEHVENKNYIPIYLAEARQENYQLHLVGYNFVVSSTSTYSKVRMTTDSFMKTEKGLSLNNVTKPAPRDGPNLRGILNRTRCYEQYTVFDIWKFF